MLRLRGLNSRLIDASSRFVCLFFQTIQLFERPCAAVQIQVSEAFNGEEKAIKTALRPAPLRPAPSSSPLLSGPPAAFSSKIGYKAPGQRDSEKKKKRKRQLKKKKKKV